MKITTVLYCDTIEPALEFWAGRLGFEKVAEVPEGDRIGFVILKSGDAELMMQTRSGVAADAPQMMEFTKPFGGVFIEVDDFERVLEAVKGLEVLVPDRTTFYGMREIVVREPGGNAICFAIRV
jgi:catechol 2,3-dioxygenase-like lactoylglutathione lyase family enzyme